jgi:alpha-beta hydrolase superfamily lysophospholipase
MTSPLYAEDRVLQLPFTDDEHTVRLWEAPQPSAVILAIHGGMAHSGDYETVGAYFRDAGVTTVSFDLTGHGRKKRIDIPGFEVFIDDATRMLDWVHTTWPQLPVFLMGHSMGALIATHMEISGRLSKYALRGVVLSSPYYANAIPVSPLVIRLSHILATLFPTAKVPMASLTEWLTHDTVISQRHREDEKSQRRASEASLRFGRSLLQAQSALGRNLAGWQHPVFAVIAGDDRLADASISRQMLDTIPEPLRTLLYFPENFHENFNETNRNDVFNVLWRWMQERLV